jgi:hypothetical protein
MFPNALFELVNKYIKTILYYYYYLNILHGPQKQIIANCKF